MNFLFTRGHDIFLDNVLDYFKVDGSAGSWDYQAAGALQKTSNKLLAYISGLRHVGNTSSHFNSEALSSNIGPG